MKFGDKILAVDSGLTACKALIFDMTGNVLTESGAATPVISSSDGASFIDMDKLWNVICSVISDAFLSGKISPAEIKCVGFSGHGNGLYCIDQNGLPVGPAVTSMDVRAKDLIDELTETQTDFLKHKSMQHIWPGQPGIILRWIKEKKPEQYRNIHKIMFCKDYLAFRLTGKVATDYSDISSSGLLDNSESTYDPEILNCLGIPEIKSALPNIIKGYDIRSGVSTQGAEDTGIPEGIPVIGGMFDVDACVYGSGVFFPKDACCIAGTWNINAVVSDKMSFYPNIRQCVKRTDGKTSLMIDSSATSSVNIEWYLKKFLGIENQYNVFDCYLKSYEITFDSPFFIPFINGSLNNIFHKGAFIGLDMTCDKGKLFAAVYEGVCFAHRYHIEKLEKSGAKIELVRITGGAARSTNFCRLFTDITGKRANTTNFSQSGALGLWAGAVVALGRYENMASAIKEKVMFCEIYSPDLARHKLFTKRYEKFKELIKCRL